MLVRGVFADLTLGLEELGVCKILSKGLIATHDCARARHNRQRNNANRSSSKLGHRLAPFPSHDDTCFAQIASGCVSTQILEGDFEVDLETTYRDTHFAMQ